MTVIVVACSVSSSFGVVLEASHRAQGSCGGHGRRVEAIEVIGDLNSWE